MKRLTLVLLFSLLLIACGGESGVNGSEKGNDSDGEKLTLRSVTGNALTLGYVADSYIPWMDKTEELAEGQLEFDFFSNGELITLTQEIDAVLDGTVDVALGYPSYQPDQFPLADVTMLPLESSDIFIATEAWKNLLASDVKLSDGQTFYESQFASKGLFVMPLATSEPYDVATTGKEFSKVEDLKGTSLRTPSSLTEMLAKNLEINSISIPGGEVYDALSRGTFDGSFIATPEWVGLGLEELFKYQVGINAGHFSGLIVMKQETFDNFPEDIQNAMIEAREETLVSGAESWHQKGIEIKENNIKQGGKFVSIDEIDSDLKDFIDEAKVKTWKQFIEKLEKENLPGKDVAILWRDLIIEAGGKVPAGVMELE